ncbi:MAG: ATP-dependent Clp protease ATP-binding subunit [Candidatus Margulisiibacteriota bacterium]|nr:ATP-dependent Clp protease ATP-binding subunit [Candidatus Margulisiibacteriota bacterium]
MFSRFTEKAIQAIMVAQEEAKRFNHSYVGTEHILLGIISDKENIVVKALVSLDVKTEDIRKLVEERLDLNSKGDNNPNIPFTQQAKQILSNAWDEARKLGHNYVNVEHLFLSIFRDPTNIAAKVLQELGIKSAKFKEALFMALGKRVESSKQSSSTVPTPTLDLFGRDLTTLAKESKLDPVVGREKELERVIQILSRRTKNNPVLTGEPGVGKTAVVEGLAQILHLKNTPEKLRDKRLITLDLGLLVAGTKYRGEFEDRVKKIMEEVRKAKNIILFIDELHTIIGTGSSEGSLDAANLFKPALARGELQCIGATTLDEYRKHIEGDGALERRFQSVLVEEPSKDQTVEILRGIKSRYEEFHKVTITEDAIQEAVEMSSRFITDRQLPDKAVDIIDEAASKVMLESSKLSKDSIQVFKDLEVVNSEIDLAQKKADSSQQESLLEKQKQLLSDAGKLSDLDKRYAAKIVDAQIVAEVVAMWTGIPVTKITQEESEKLLKMDQDLSKKIIGQEEAVKAVVRAVKRSKVGLKNPKRPTGSFLFLGPTGVGKSELAKQMALNLFGKEDAMIRIDMSEYMEKHTVSRLIGSPPGYVGYDDGGQLTEPVRQKPYSIVLFDEIEKASPDVLNILLQILEDGMVTDSNGRTVDFKNTIIVMTSNVGAKYIQKTSSLGFQTTSEEEANYNNMKEKLKDEISREFRPEFINRIDDIVVFKPLTKDAMIKIAHILVAELSTRLAEKNIRLKVDEAVVNLITDKGTNLRMGARPLRRSLQENLEDPMADALLKKNLRTDLSISCNLSKGKVSFIIRQLKPKPKESSILTTKELINAY